MDAFPGIVRIVLGLAALAATGAAFVYYEICRACRGFVKDYRSWKGTLYY